MFNTSGIHRKVGLGRASRMAALCAIVALTSASCEVEVVETEKTPTPATRSDVETPAAEEVKTGSSLVVEAETGSVTTVASDDAGYPDTRPVAAPDGDTTTTTPESETATSATHAPRPTTTVAVMESKSVRAVAEEDAPAYFHSPTTTFPAGVILPLPPRGDGDVFYEDYGVNLPTETAQQPYSTFGLDTDTAGWFRQFLYLDQGLRPHPDAIRVEEIVNAFPARCEVESPLSVRICAQVSDHPFRGDGTYRLLRVAVDVAPVDRRPPTTYIVALDRSGSMSRGDRWNVALGVIRRLLDGMRPEDRMGMVSFNHQAAVDFEPADTDSARALYSDTALYPDGSTNAADGLRLGYEMAGGERENHPDRQALVVFLSDGVANAGFTTEPGGIIDLMEKAASDLDIGMAAAGVGEGNYNDYLLEQVADRAQGWYQYLFDDVSTGRFVSKVRAGIVGWEAKAQVEFNPDTVRVWRLIGYENRRIDAELFRQDERVARQSAPLVGGSSSAAWYEIELTNNAEGSLAEATVRYRTFRDCDFQESVVEAGLVDVSAFSDAACDYRVQGYAAWYAEFARQSPFAWKNGSPRSLMELLDGDPGPDAGDCLSGIDELRSVLGRYIEADPHPSVDR